MSVTALVLGDATCGKTMLAQALVGVRPPSQQTLPDYAPTVGAELLCSDDGSLAVWDMPGQDRLMSVRGGGVSNNVSVCILVYDVSDGNSLEHLNDWCDEHALFAHGTAASPVRYVLVGTKADLEEAVSHTTADEWAARSVVHQGSRPMVHVRCSALTHTGVKDVRRLVLEQAALPATDLESQWLPRWEAMNVGPTAVVRTAVTIEVPSLRSDALIDGVITTAPAVLDVRVGTLAEPPTPAGAHLCVMITRLRFAAVSVNQFVQWHSNMCRLSGLRNPQKSLSFVVVGVPEVDFTEETAAALRDACFRVGARLIVLHGITDSWYTQAVEHVVEDRQNAIVERSAVPSTCRPWVPPAPSPALEDSKVPSGPRDALQAANVNLLAHPGAAQCGTDAHGSAVAAEVTALQRRMLDVELQCERRVAALKEEHAQEVAAVRGDVAAAEKRCEHLEEQLKDVRLELKVMWDAIEARAAA